jgi:hypothetical protein
MQITVPAHGVRPRIVPPRERCCCWAVECGTCAASGGRWSAGPLFGAGSGLASETVPVADAPLFTWLGATVRKLMLPAAFEVAGATSSIAVTPSATTTARTVGTVRVRMLISAANLVSQSCGEPRDRIGAERRLAHAFLLLGGVQRGGGQGLAAAELLAGRVVAAGDEGLTVGKQRRCGVGVRENHRAGRRPGAGGG